MVDPATIAALVKEAIDGLKEVASLTKGAKDHGVNEKVLNLQQRLIEFQSVMMKATAENEKLRRRVAELESTEEIAMEMVYEVPVYWRVHSDGKRDGPFCRSCWESERKTIHVRPDLKGCYYCETCKRESKSPNAESGIAFVSRPSHFDDFNDR